MRILDMTQPITIGDIYTNVYILEKLTAARRLELSELLANIQTEKQKEFERDIKSSDRKARKEKSNLQKQNLLPFRFNNNNLNK